MGAGIHGACAAWDATSRGLTTALVERGDFGSATSANSLKIVHGGLRYLRSADLRRMRESIRERSALLRIAPLWVQPQPFLVGLGNGPLDGTSAFRAALGLSDLIGFDRNAGLSPDRAIPAGEIVDQGRAVGLAPLLGKGSSRGAAVWYDAVMRDSERLLLSFVLSAIRAGAVAANHVEALPISGERPGPAVVSVRDRETGDQFEVRARCVLDASGPWAGNQVEGSAAVAVNVVLTGSDSQAGVGIPIPTGTEGDPLGGNRFLFLLPWDGRELGGTWYRRATREDLDPEPEAIARDIDALMRLIESTVGRAAADRDRLRFFHRGVIPADWNRVGGPRLAERSTVVSRPLGSHGATFVSVSGVKYTTARHTAERAIDAVFSALGKRSPACRTAETPLVGAGVARGANPAAWEDRQLEPESGERLLERYGDRWEDVLASTGGPAEARQLSPGCPVLRTEVLFAVRHECTVTLADIVLRRTGLGATGRPDRRALEACAWLAGEELGWTADRREEEIEAVNALFDPVDMVRSGAVGQV